MYVLIVKKFRNDSFIITWVIKKCLGRGQKKTLSPRSPSPLSFLFYLFIYLFIYF